MKKFAVLFIVLFGAAAFAQDLPRIAVYVTGNVGDDEKKALGTRMLASLINSKRYKGIERSNSFLAEIEKEQVKQRSGAIDDNQISQLGRQFGVKFVCIADITPAFGEFQVSARIVDVETAEVIFIGESSGKLSSMADLSQVSDKVVANMFNNQTIMASVPKPLFTPAPVPEKITEAPVQAKTTPLAADETVTFDDVFFPSKKGMKLSYEIYDERHKKLQIGIGSSQIIIKSVTGSAKNGTIVCTRTSKTYTKEYRVNVVNGVLELPRMFRILGNVRADIDVKEDTRIVLPSRLMPGDILQDASASVSMYVDRLKKTMEYSITETDRRYTGIETVTVKAGTFECYRIEQKTTEAQEAVMSNLNTTIWYARGIGMVKEAHYGPNGKLVMTTELQKLVK